jgi:peptidoglycan biosynthesis protein MviN/MurJ (putative lipid II flippase)
VNKIFKKLLFMLLLLLSPLVTLAVLGAAYIAIRVLSGFEFSASVNSFKEFIYNLRSYFPYLTIIPAATFILAHLNKDKIKVINLRK